MTTTYPISFELLEKESKALELSTNVSYLDESDEIYDFEKSFQAQVSDEPNENKVQENRKASDSERITPGVDDKDSSDVTLHEGREIKAIIDVKQEFVHIKEDTFEEPRDSPASYRLSMVSKSCTRTGFILIRH